MNVAQALNIGDLRRMARRHLPKVIFETIESGVEDERGVDRNQAAFEEQLLYPRYLIDVSAVDTSTTLFGRRHSVPFGLAPTGFAGVFREGADTMMACAATAADIPMILSGASIETLEDVSRAAPETVWSHIYTAKDGAVTEDLIDRAADCGREVLVLTVDNPVYPNRERDTRNRFGKPIAQQSITTILESALHPAWCLAFLRRGGFPVMENWARYAVPGATGPQVAAYFRSQSPNIVTWKDLERVRSRWKGRLVIKGLQHSEDARICRESGVDGVIVSNHGAKAHDPLPAPLHALPAVRNAVGVDYPVMIDSGIRRGSDIVVAGCLGASFAFIGRPALYGVAAGGEAGVARAIAILQREINLSLALIGCPSFTELGPQFLFRS
jgi:isopentenyl diphosphate isomerase/L-lactate dehydrogenase-like FMN-dependent dehydrogenase